MLSDKVYHLGKVVCCRNHSFFAKHKGFHGDERLCSCFFIVSALNPAFGLGIMNVGNVFSCSIVRNPAFILGDENQCHTF